MHLVEPPMFSKINQKSNLVKKQGWRFHKQIETCFKNLSKNQQYLSKQMFLATG